MIKITVLEDDKEVVYTYVSITDLYTDYWHNETNIPSDDSKVINIEFKYIREFDDLFN